MYEKVKAQLKHKTKSWSNKKIKPEEKKLGKYQRSV